MRNNGTLPTPLRPLSLEQVTVGGEIGRRIELAIYKNFMALDIERDFLTPFRQRMAHPKLRFNGLGMLLDAAVLFSKYTNDEQVISRKNYLVEECIKTQSAEGYIGIFEAEPEAGQLWGDYCVHEVAYLVLGLAEDYRQFANEEALASGRRLADYLMANWAKRPDGSVFTTLGIAEAFVSLYELTGEKRYLRFAADERLGKAGRIGPGALSSWEQEIRDFRREGDSVGCHMYRVFSRCMMQLRLREFEPAQNLELMTRRVLEGMTRRERSGMFITGSTSLEEYWHGDQDGRGKLAENCATIYQLRLLDVWMRLNGELRFGDIMERAVYNSLFASQDPSGRRIRYSTCFSGPRTYHRLDSYCCPNNFRRGMARLPQLIYYQSEDGVAVNLYTTSRARLEMPDGLSLSISQQTDYPNSGVVEITVEPSQPAKFTLWLRIPRWARTVALVINGKPVESLSGSGGFTKITRDWQTGDAITLEMPMSWRFVKGREMQFDRAALMRGPIVYCLSPELNPGVADLQVLQRGDDALGTMDPGMEDAKLREITLDPGSLSGPEPDSSVRSDGLGARIKAWSPRRNLADPTDLDLILSEFTEPNGQEIYFRLPVGAAVTDDELLEDKML